MRPLLAFEDEILIRDLPEYGRLHLHVRLSQNVYVVLTTSGRVNAAKKSMSFVGKLLL